MAATHIPATVIPGIQPQTRHTISRPANKYDPGLSFPFGAKPRRFKRLVDPVAARLPGRHDLRSGSRVHGMHSGSVRVDHVDRSSAQVSERE